VKDFSEATHLDACGEDDPDACEVLSKSERRRRAKARALPTWRETSAQTRSRRTALVKSLALGAGFSRVGIAPATALVEDRARLQAWVDAGYHASMDWLAESLDRRCDPGSLVAGAQAVVMLALDYDTQAPHTRDLDLRGEDRAWISRYAWGTDYHVVVERQLRTLEAAITRALKPELGETFRGPGGPVGPFRAAQDLRWYVDHGPVLERSLAVQAGLGWRGKHSLVLHPKHGSFFFLACIVTSLGLDVDPPMMDHCGTCTACLDACPTGAIVAPYVVDARKCISHVTIETAGTIAQPERGLVGDHLFGCDLCQDVCPWNRFSQPVSEPAFQPRPGNVGPKLAAIEALDEAAFAERFAQSPLKRRGLVGVQDNAAAVREGRRQR